MCVTYNIYPNLGNLRSDYPKEAKELVKSVADGDWKTNRIYYFPTTSDFAGFQIYDDAEGAYYKMLHEKDETSPVDYSGLPFLADYTEDDGSYDLEALGDDMVKEYNEYNEFDDSNIFITSHRQVIYIKRNWSYRKR